MAKPNSLRKPTLDPATVRQFAEGHTRKPTKTQSGQIPAGDVRLTANIREDLHLKLKIRAAQERTTVGELIERWIESWEAAPSRVVRGR